MASVSATVTTVVNIPRERFFDWLIPGVFGDRLNEALTDAAGLPGISTTTETTGPWDVPGSKRLIHLTDNNTVREEVTDVDKPSFFAYRVWDFSHPIRFLAKGAGGQWWYTDEGNATHVKWTYTFDARTIFAYPILWPFIKVFWRKYMENAIEGTRKLAEKELGESRE